MALRSTFAEVVTMVRNEARQSTNSSRSTDHTNYIKELIKRYYETLSEDFEWEHLKITKDTTVGRKVLAAGQRYYDFPTTLNILKINPQAWVKHSGIWKPVNYGIGFDQYSIYDPADSARSDPVERWNFYNSQFEVWPVPSVNGAADADGEIAFEGQKLVTALTADADRLDMDGRMISLFVAAEILASDGQKTAAEVKASAATARRDRMSGALSNKRRVTLGTGYVDQGRARPRHPTYVSSTS